jgi:hypothetical protein
MADKPSTAAKSLFSSACIAGLVQRYGEKQRLDDCILSQAKMCENCCAYFDLALSFQPPANPADPLSALSRWLVNILPDAPQDATRINDHEVAETP